MKKLFLTYFIPVVSLFSFPMAYAQDTIGLETCTVRESLDVRGVTDNGVTLSQALLFALDNDPARRQCTKQILLDGFSQMQMSGPLVLYFPTAPAGNNVQAGDKYVFGGSDASHPVILDFSHIGSSTDSMTYCALTVKNTSNLLIKNLVIKGSPSSGICLGGMDNQNIHAVELDNVSIDGAQGHGIIFRANASSSVIHPNSSILNPGGDGVHVAGTGTTLNQLIATDQVDSGITNEGLAQFSGTGAAPVDFSFSGIGTSNAQAIPISTENGVRIRICDITPTNPQRTKFRIEGDVVQLSSSLPSSASQQDINNALAQAQRIGGVKRLQVYTLDRQNNNQGKFATYVESRTAFGTAINGVDTGDPTVIPYTFTFEFDKTTFNNSDLIALVPEMSGSQIGGSSAVITVQANSPSVTGCGGGGAAGGMGTGRTNGARKILSIDQCLQLHSGGAPLPVRTYDSDGDGLWDEEEDQDGDCRCTNADLSCWFQPDTDGDGILDSLETNGGEPYIFVGKNADGTFVGATETRTGLTRVAGAFCVPTTDGKDLCNADGGTGPGSDSVSNANDPDSDNDGVDDWREARRRALNPFKSSKLTALDGTQYDCSLGPDYTKGIHWSVYWYKKGEQPTPFQSGGRDRSSDGYQLIPLACKNQALTNTDFDASVNTDTGETNPYNIDTDQDGWCDGDGPACTTALAAGALTGGINDNCPTIVSTDNTCSPECFLHEDLYRIRDRSLLAFDPNDPDEPIDLADANNNSVKDINEITDWQRLYTVCDDLDGDTIPDCVERMNPQCSPLLQSSGALNPHTNDTDGDGVPDNIDANPFDSTVTTITDDNRDSLRTVFRQAQVPIIRCFVDRDQDGLTDCQEDLNRDDSFQRSSVDLATFLANPSAIESDPLKPDSDGDGLNDKIERDIGTNPQNRDTDGDGLSDRLEVKGDARDSYESRDGSGCSTFTRIPPGTDLVAYSQNAIGNTSFRLGTNPTDPDTDHDGIPDNIEVMGTIAGKINQADLLANLLQGFDVVSNPLAKDTDGDGLNDLDEYGTDGVMDHMESNPCDSNTDSDSISLDKDEPKGCATNPDERCVASATGSTGLDSDADGLPDFIEATLGTDPHNPDTDGDGLKDGDEDINHDGIIQKERGETDPRCLPLKDDGSCVGFDTDGDGLRDGAEVKLGTNPNLADSDLDCIPDGVEVHFNEFSSFTGTDTNPTSPDTDGDGLCDGNNSQTGGGVAGNVNCIRGEDMNCNGVVDKDPNDPNRFAETDPRLADTDQDGVDDKTEICSGGQCNIAANIGHATLGASQGCFNLSGAAESGASAPTSMLYLYGLLLALNRVVVRKFRKQSTKHQVLSTKY